MAKVYTALVYIPDILRHGVSCNRGLKSKKLPRTSIHERMQDLNAPKCWSRTRKNHGESVAEKTEIIWYAFSKETQYLWERAMEEGSQQTTNRGRESGQNNNGVGNLRIGPDAGATAFPTMRIAFLYTVLHRLLSLHV